MALLKFAIEIESINDPSLAAYALRGCILCGMGNGWYRDFTSYGLSVTPYQPNPVDAHGEHGMAHGVSFDDSIRSQSIGRMVNVGLDDVGPSPLHQPEKHPAACACCMGAGAQPYAHEPSCPVHPRYVDTGLSDADKPPQDVHTSLLDGSKCNGERAKLEAEYLGALASLKARGGSNGSLHRIFELGESLGRSVSGVCSDFNR